MSDITFTVEGVLHGTKYALGPTPVRVQVRLPSADNLGADQMVTLPVPIGEATAEVYRMTREVLPRRAIERGDGGKVTITVTIEGD